ncbi:MAG: hypothetical protein ACO1TE_17210 [Prosthecobacter sp.]
MTTIPQTQEALQHTAADLRLLGQAAKADIQRLQHDAQELARTRVIEPGVRMVKDASQRLEEQARRSASMAREKMDDVCGYVVENPGRALLGAVAGGLVLGFLFRR